MVIGTNKRGARTTVARGDIPWSNFSINGIECDKCHKLIEWNGRKFRKLPTYIPLPVTCSCSPGETVNSVVIQGRGRWTLEVQVWDFKPTTKITMAYMRFMEKPHGQIQGIMIE